MLAWLLERPGAIEHLRLREHPDPHLEDHGLMVRVQGAAVNPADLTVIAGGFGARFVRARKYPLVPGFDFCGRVEAIGAHVEGWREGDEVFGFLPYRPSTTRGTFAQRVAVAPHEVAAKPATIAASAAAGAATVGVTALQAIRLAGGSRVGDRWLVHGASGGLGSFLVSMGRLAGVEVWGTCSESSLSYVRRLGAERAFDYRKTKLSDLGPRFNVIFDVAAKSSYHACERRLKTGGTYLTTQPSLRLLTGMLRSTMSPRACRLVSVRPDAEDLATLARMIDDRRLKVPIDSSWSMNDVPGALRRLSQGGVRGKVTVAIG